MKFTNLLSLAVATLSATTTTAVATAPDYFFLFSGSTKFPAINNERLRSNTSATYISPGVTPPPHNPADHFNRISVASPGDPYTILYVVPTNPHPPPVPGYYGLSDRDGVPDAYRLVYTYRLEDEGAGFLYKEWQLLRTPGRCVPKGKVLLRYKPVGGGQWRWFAVKEKTPQGVDKWVPWYVKRSPANEAALAKWDYDAVELELVEAKGPVNSGAPGGVEE